MGRGGPCPFILLGKTGLHSTYWVAKLPRKLRLSTFSSVACHLSSILHTLYSPSAASCRNLNAYLSPATKRLPAGMSDQLDHRDNEKEIRKKFQNSKSEFLISSIRYARKTPFIPYGWCCIPYGSRVTGFPSTSWGPLWRSSRPWMATSTSVSAGSSAVTTR